MSEAKKSKFQNIRENLPIKTRIYIGVMIGISSVCAFGLYSAFASDEEPSGQQQVAQSRIDIGGRDGSIRKSKLTEDRIYDEDSPMAEKVKEGLKQKEEEAKQSEGGGYMDPFDLGAKSKTDTDELDALFSENLANAQNKLNLEVDSQYNRTRVDTDESMAKRNAELLERLKDMSERVDQMEGARGQFGANGPNGNSSSAGNGANGANGLVAYKKRYAEALTKKFLDEELKKAESTRSAMFSAAKGLDSSLGSYAGGGGSSNSSGGSSSGGSNSYGGSSRGSVSGSGDPYLSDLVNRDRYADAQPDFSTMEKANRMAEQQYNTQHGGSSNMFGGNERPGSQPVDTSVASRSDKKPIKSVGDICYAQLNMPVNTDRPTPIKATILDYNCGPLRGAQLISDPKRVDTAVTLKFNTMNHDGRSKSLNAIALDPESKAGFLADDVDRHIFSRYLSLAIAAGIPGWAESVQTTDIEKDENGNTYATQSKVTGADQVAVITGAIAETLVPAMQQNFQRPPTVKLTNGRPILVMFMDDLVL